MEKLKRIASLSTQADGIRDVIIFVIFQLGELYIKGEKEKFIPLLKLGRKRIEKYKYLLQEIYLELEDFDPDLDLPPVDPKLEWNFFCNFFLCLINAEAQSEIFLNMLQLLENLSGIRHD